MKNNWLRIEMMAVSVSLMLAAAPGWSALETGAPAAPDAPPTFSGSIAHIVYNNCTPCHRPEGGAPFHFTNYEEVRKRARLIAHVTADKLMPPWKADKGDVAFMGERHLSEEQIAALAAWFEAGAPQGDPAAEPSPPVFEAGWKNGAPDMVIEMEQEFEVPADGPDIYRAFVVRMPDLPEGTYLKGLEFRPRALGSAHHTLFSLDTTGESRLRDEASERPGFGGMEGNVGLGRISGWAVGSVQHLYPDGVAIPVPHGADLLLNSHFHPSGKVEVERAQIGLYLTKEKPTKHMVTLDVPFGFGVLKGLRIPAGEKNHVVTESFTLPEGVDLVGIGPHAHYIATSMRAEATLPDGRSLTLISIPRWDFAWQEQYRLAEPLHLPKGTRIDMEFHYDNSAENPYNPNHPPKEITFGPESTDEMACMTLMFTSESAETMASLKQNYVAWVKEGVKTADLGMLAKSAREQRREALDLNSDGTVTIGEVIQRIKTVRRRMAGAEGDSLHLQILSAMAARMLRTVLLPWLLPRVAVAAAVLAIVVYLIRRLRRARRKKSQDSGLPQGA